MVWNSAQSDVSSFCSTTHSHALSSSYFAHQNGQNYSHLHPIRQLSLTAQDAFVNNPIITSHRCVQNGCRLLLVPVKEVNLFTGNDISTIRISFRDATQDISPALVTNRGRWQLFKRGLVLNGVGQFIYRPTGQVQLGV
ncbi:unnamed protein product [Protopolystoma xenopodis]|uniref:Uncharacterized protein n=1 Tax=Protopolystoma xenopodis TaxID=117903 RepID=A0A3S5AD02_9PLAT|nr:unnamed protein product [Protopolystoma xenopodis]